MKLFATLAALAATVTVAAPVEAAGCKALTTAQLSELTAGGMTLQLGGEGEGYSGSLKLNRNGSGKGSARTDAGQKISIAGTWRIADDRFCRIWSDLDDGQEVCETWCLTSGNSVDVYNGKRKIGVSAW